MVIRGHKNIIGRREKRASIKTGELLLKRETGFTLLEVMVSLAILGIGILMVMQLFSGGLGLAMAANEHTDSVLLAREKMAETLANQDIYPYTKKGTSGTGLLWQVDVGTVENADTDSIAGLYIMKILVSVTKPQKREPTYTLTSMKSIFLEE